MTDNLKRRIDLEESRIRAYAATSLGQLADCRGDCLWCQRWPDCEMAGVLAALYGRLIDRCKQHPARPVKEAP